MSEDILKECYFFLHAAFAGVVLSGVYDLFRILRRVRAHGCIWVAVEDFIYWIGGAIYISYVLMEENNGIIRWFFVIGILLGMLLYNLTISRYLVGISSKIINKILDVGGKVLKVLFKPVVILCKILKKIFLGFVRIGKNLKRILKKCYKTVKIGVSKK